MSPPGANTAGLVAPDSPQVAQEQRGDCRKIFSDSDYSDCSVVSSGARHVWTGRDGGIGPLVRRRQRAKDLAER